MYIKDMYSWLKPRVPFIISLHQTLLWGIVPYHSHGIVCKQGTGRSNLPNILSTLLQLLLSSLPQQEIGNHWPNMDRYGKTIISLHQT